MPSIFDTHAHLNSLSNFPSYFCLNVTTIPSEWVTALQIHQLNPNIIPALGIHPWFVDEVSDNDFVSLEALLTKESVYAMGEIGLDFSEKFKTFKQLQMEVFEKQLNLAQQYQLPVSIHCVKAHNEMISLLKEYNLPRRGVMHGLGASKEIIKQYIDLGFKIGVNGVVCRDNARRYHEMIRDFSLDNFVLETDFPNVMLPSSSAPDLADINLVAHQIADLKPTSVEEVIAKTYYNAQQVFLR